MRTTDMSQFSLDKCMVCGKPLSLYKRYYCSKQCREIARRKVWKKPKNAPVSQGASWDEVIQWMKKTGLQYADFVTRFEYGSTE